VTAAATSSAARPAPRRPLERGPKTWTLRRTEELVLQVWRCIANAGPQGISPTDVRKRLNNIDEEALKLHLSELRRKGHIVFKGHMQYGFWTATAKHPLTEEPPLWLRGLDTADDDPPGAGIPRAVANPLQQAAGVVEEARKNAPNSVFDLGIKGFGVDIDAAHMPAAHKIAMAAAAPPAKPAGPPEPIQRPPATPGEPSMLFALASDNTLNMVHADGRQFRLSPDDTRALFAYLDRLMAIGHGSLTEATS
jgi:hypothetical protein